MKLRFLIVVATEKMTEAVSRNGVELIVPGRIKFRFRAGYLDATVIWTYIRCYILKHKMLRNRLAKKICLYMFVCGQIIVFGENLESKKSICTT